MDYEKKYKDILSLAKSYKGNNLKEFLDLVFPELAESEDERIRRWLSDILDESNWGKDWPYTKQQVINYLEKQKENPKSADSIQSDCVSDAKCEDRWHKVTDSLPDNGREVLAKDKLGNILLARYDGEGWAVSVYDDEDYRCHNGISKWCEIPLEKQKEQKPAKWSEEDERLLKTTLECLNYISCQSKVPVVNWLKSLPERFNLQPKQEWSEDDSLHLTNAILCAESEWGVESHTAKWLKSLRPQLKEWSEEDEDYMNAIITIINRETALYPKGGATENLNNDLIAWLKGRLKSFRSQPHWKPSEEEMQALSWAINYFADIENVCASGLELLKFNLKEML